MKHTITSILTLTLNKQNLAVSLAAESLRLAKTGSIHFCNEVTIVLVCSNVPPTVSIALLAKSVTLKVTDGTIHKAMLGNDLAANSTNEIFNLVSQSAIIEALATDSFNLLVSSAAKSVTLLLCDRFFYFIVKIRN